MNRVIVLQLFLVCRCVVSTVAASNVEKVTSVGVERMEVETAVVLVDRTSVVPYYLKNLEIVSAEWKLQCIGLTHLANFCGPNICLGVPTSVCHSCCVVWHC